MSSMFLNGASSSKPTTNQNAPKGQNTMVTKPTAPCIPCGKKGR